MAVQAVDIIAADEGSFVPAELHDNLPVETLFDVEDQWADRRRSIRATLRAAGVPTVDWPESLHWDWGRKSLEVAVGHDPADVRVMGICRDGSWEAAMATLRRREAGRPLLYVEYIEVAPWNWPVDLIGQRRRYAAVGSILLYAAVRQSISDGFGGRVGLHALPGAETFYRRQGFRFVRRDVNKENLAYYELAESPPE